MFSGRARSRRSGAPHDSGLHVIVVTGRMVRSVRRALEPAGLDDPLICYQGAVVVDGDGTWIRHTPIPLELAREAIAFAADEGYSPNVYVGDELFVAEVTQHARDYASSSTSRSSPSAICSAGSRSRRRSSCSSAIPTALDAVESRAKARFGDDLYISKSLPYFLEFAAAGVTKGTGLDFLAARMGFTPEETIAFGDGENDVELSSGPATASRSRTRTSA